jgi:hypothetical protein
MSDDARHPGDWLNHYIWPDSDEPMVAPFKNRAIKDAADFVAILKAELAAVKEAVRWLSEEWTWAADLRYLPENKHARTLLEVLEK